MILNKVKDFILSNIDEFNTFEAYYDNPIIKENYITIPYINMDLMEKHPLNFSKQQLFIDLCYLQIVEPKYISVYKKGIMKNELDNYEEEYSRWYGGSFIGDSSILDAEMEIQAKEVYLIVPNNYRTSSKMWIPDIDRFKGRGNISREDVLKFISKTSTLNKIIINFEATNNNDSVSS